MKRSDYMTYNCRCYLIPRVTSGIVMGRTEINQAQPFKGRIVDIKGNDKMSIKIKVDKIKKYKITDLDALSKEDLPEEYINGLPNVQKYGDGFILKYIDRNRTDEYNYVSINKGDEFTESEMRTLDHYIRLAGERLGRINQKIKRDTDKKKNETPPKPIDDWSGSYTFEV